MVDILRAESDRLRLESWHERQRQSGATSALTVHLVDVSAAALEAAHLKKVATHEAKHKALQPWARSVIKGATL
jgi:hypothetical protein